MIFFFSIFKLLRKLGCLTSIFLPSTTDAWSCSLALSASELLANVTKPKPLDPRSLKMISTSRMGPNFCKGKKMNNVGTNNNTVVVDLVDCSKYSHGTHYTLSNIESAYYQSDTNIHNCKRALLARTNIIIGTYAPLMQSITKIKTKSYKSIHTRTK